jgi:hypothetical protein
MQEDVFSQMKRVHTNGKSRQRPGVFEGVADIPGPSQGSFYPGRGDIFVSAASRKTPAVL